MPNVNTTFRHEVSSVLQHGGPVVQVGRMTYIVAETDRMVVSYGGLKTRSTIINYGKFKNTTKYPKNFFSVSLFRC